MSIECREAGADPLMYCRRAQSRPRRQFKNTFPRGEEASRALGFLSILTARNRVWPVLPRRAPARSRAPSPRRKRQ